MSPELLNQPRGIERYRVYLGARYATFLFAFEEFIANGGKTVVELGTTRSFVSGGYPGCMVNDARYWNVAEPKTWDWGAGMFTRMCAEHLQAYQPEIHSIDVSPAAIEISRVIMADVSQSIAFHLTRSENFLQSINGKIDLLYMDAGETDESADELHLREARIVLERDLLSPRAIVLIDDVNIPGTTASKGKLSIPYLRKHGFEIRKSGYQVVMQKPHTTQRTPQA